jgi:Zn-dependent M16 (insulinase) family peptidase
MDHPMSSDQKGSASLQQYLTGETQAQRQKWRDEVLDTSLTDFTVFGERINHVLGQRQNGEGEIVVVGSKAALEACAGELGLKLTNILE